MSDYDRNTAAVVRLRAENADLRAERDEVMSLAKQAQVRVGEVLAMLRDAKAERDAARAECHRWAEKCEDITAEWRKAEEAEAVARADAARLREALEEIARQKRGIDANDSDKEWIEYLCRALERERATARFALASTPTMPPDHALTTETFAPSIHAVALDLAALEGDAVVMAVPGPKTDLVPRAELMRVAEAVRDDCFFEWASERLRDDKLEDVDLTAIVGGGR